jgi:hypothetical protein
MKKESLLKSGKKLMRMKINMRYILHPGTVCSNTDGDCHFISARKLAELYKVPFHLCHVLDSKDPNTYLRFQETENDVHLYPKPDGNYNLIIEEDK